MVGIMFKIPLTITISKAYLNLLVIFSNGEWNRKVMSTPMILDHCQFNRLKSKIIQRNRKKNTKCSPHIFHLSRNSQYTKLLVALTSILSCIQTGLTWYIIDVNNILLPSFLLFIFFLFSTLFKHVQ